VPFSPAKFRRQLLAWYDASHRKLPWRETTDPYAVWISEVMLQQTRVAAVIPYYQRFLDRFPTIQALADAKEEDLLFCWSGLGYYSRARNLQLAARHMAGCFPTDYDAIRGLPGIGDYTAAAVASIAFNLPYAAVDGNVLRVLARLTDDASDIAALDTKRTLQLLATALLDRTTPGKFNQAVMELGATVCLPKQPQCLLCPVRNHCAAAARGTQNQLPVKLRKARAVRTVRTLLIVCKNGTYLVWQRPFDARILAGLWELPEPEHVPDASMGELIGTFRHSITVNDYTFRVCRANVACVSPSMRWLSAEDLNCVPLSTTTRKALRIAAVMS
jgi:A/G-specific adenine glycosylase